MTECIATRVGAIMFLADLATTGTLWCGAVSPGYVGQDGNRGEKESWNVPGAGGVSFPKNRDW